MALWTRPHAVEQDEPSALEDVLACAILGMVLLVPGAAAQIPPGSASRVLQASILAMSAMLSFGIFLFVLIRHGYLAAAFLVFFQVLFLLFPISMDFSAFYAAAAFLALLPVTAVAPHGLHISRGGRPLVSGAFLPE